jgi:REP element-mobilizing transposase RayT
MGHPLRSEDPAAVYHAISRGNNRGRIVWDHHDCASLTGELARVATKYGWEVLAWCLMTTHYHVVLRVPRGGLSAGFQQLNGNHARRTNRRYGRVGHLFENRFFSDVIAGAAHLVASVLYVARNPVRAGICSEAGMWADSSYRATAGLCDAPGWLALHEVLPLFGDERIEAQAQYARLVHYGHLPVSDTIERVMQVEPWQLDERESGLTVAHAA